MGSYSRWSIHRHGVNSVLRQLLYCNCLSFYYSLLMQRILMTSIVTQYRKINGNKTKTFWKNESNVGLRSQKGWEQGRVVGTVRGMLTLTLVKVWKQGRVVVTVHIAPWMHKYSITSSLHCSSSHWMFQSAAM